MFFFPPHVFSGNRNRKRENRNPVLTVRDHVVRHNFHMANHDLYKYYSHYFINIQLNMINSMNDFLTHIFFFLDLRFLRIVLR